MYIYIYILCHIYHIEGNFGALKHRRIFCQMYFVLILPKFAPTKVSLYTAVTQLYLVTKYVSVFSTHYDTEVV